MKWRLVLAGIAAAATHVALFGEVRTFCGKPVFATAGKLRGQVTPDDVTCRRCRKKLDRLLAVEARERERERERQERKKKRAPQWRWRS